MKRQFAILSIANEPTFTTEAEVAVYAQKLANEESEAVWYETEHGEAECVPIWSVGEHYFAATGLMHGRAWDIGNDSQPCRRREDAEALGANWLSFLTAGERQYADTYVREYLITSVEDGGATIGSSRTCE